MTEEKRAGSKEQGRKSGEHKVRPYKPHARGTGHTPGGERADERGANTRFAATNPTRKGQGTHRKESERTKGGRGMTEEKRAENDGDGVLL